jgi:hypothetical protein
MARLMLSEMLNDLRAEAGISLAPGHNLASRDAHIILLRRVQRELWLQNTWPDQIVYRDTYTASGQRTYEYPDDVDFESIQDAWVDPGGPVGNTSRTFTVLAYGVGPDEVNYNTAGFTGQPVKWQHFSDNEDQFELWPVPDGEYTVRLKGMKRLGRLVEDTDRSTIDGTLIVLYAASELLAQAKSDLATVKHQKATAYFQRLRGMLSSQKTEPFVIGGGPSVYQPRIGLDYIPPGYGSGPGG